MQIKKSAAVLTLSAVTALSAAAGSRYTHELKAGPLTVASDSTEALSRAFRRASERAQPSLVHVRVERKDSRVTTQAPDDFEGTPFEEFFEGMIPRGLDPQPQHSSGSGFIFRADGHVLTNNHVVADGGTITVVLNDGREFAAKLVGRDPNTDVAVLKIDGKDLPVGQLGDADRIEVGDWVIALGYPMELGPTVTAGIVSAKGRSLGIIERSSDAQAPLEHFIQTDAAINPGNSGGPLVDLQGRIVGMNTAIASPTGYYSGYGFAVPVNLVVRVATDLIQYGEVRRPKIGVAVSDLDQVDADVYKLDRPAGAEVTQITPGSPAAAAGLKLGDVIVAVNGTKVKDSGALTELLARQRPGETVELRVHRYGTQLNVKVKLGMFAAARQSAGASDEARATSIARLGFTVTESGRDVIVADVAAGSAAARSGLARGMVIEQLNGKTVNDVADVMSTVEKLRSGSVMSLIVRDAEGRRTIMNFRVPEA